MRKATPVIAWLAVVLVTLAVLAPPAVAQGGPTRDDVLTEAFRDVGRLAARSVVRVHDGGSPIGYAAVIEEGWAVTAERVVRDTRDLRIEAPDGEIAPARLTGRDGWLDVALLRFDPDAARLPPIRRGGPARTGQWLISAGTDETPLSAGVASAAGRDVTDKRKTAGIALPFVSPGFRTPLREYRGVIQHDSPIEEGQLGSPVVDTEGRMVGLNVARPHRGTAYATPISDIVAALPALREGLVREPPPDIGAFPEFHGPKEVFDSFRELFDEDLREWLDELKRLGEEIWPELQKWLDELNRMDQPRPPPPPPPAAQQGYLGVRPARDAHPEGGIPVEKVYSGSPASRADLRPGDRIMAVDGMEVRSIRELKDIFSSRTAGSTVRITFQRLDPDTGLWQERTLPITLSPH